MECKCDALGDMKKDGGEYIEKLVDLYNNREPRSFTSCTICFKKPETCWIWESLAREALLKGLANTDVLK